MTIAVGSRKQAGGKRVQSREGDYKMANSTNEFISTMNDLIETCKDGEQGFRDAADAVTRTDLRSLFNEYARQRSQFASELQVQVSRIGGDPEKSGSVSGSLHRGWINLKSAITGK